MNLFIKKGLLFLFMSYYGVYSQETKEIILDGFSLNVPVEILLQNDKDKLAKYKSIQQMPEIEYQNKDGSINIIYKKTEVPLGTEQLIILKSNLEKQYSHPSIDILKSEIIKLDDKNFVLLKASISKNGILITNLVTNYNSKMVMIVISISDKIKNYNIKSDNILNSLRIK